MVDGNLDQIALIDNHPYDVDTDSACYKADMVYPYVHSNDHSNHQ